MSLRIIFRPGPNPFLARRTQWPARRRGSDTDVWILFDSPIGDYEPISFDELVETMKFHHLALLVDQEPGKTFHKFHQHS